MRQLIILITIISTVNFCSCEKSSNCYNKEMEQNHSGICAEDCPGVCGCDGKTYCNECVANGKGFKVDAHGPCN